MYSSGELPAAFALRTKLAMSVTSFLEISVSFFFSVIVFTLLMGPPFPTLLLTWAM